MPLTTGKNDKGKVIEATKKAVEELKQGGGGGGSKFFNQDCEDATNENNTLRNIEGFRTMMRKANNFIYPELSGLFMQMDNYLQGFEDTIRNVNGVRVQKRHDVKSVKNKNSNKPWSERR